VHLGGRAPSELFGHSSIVGRNVYRLHVGTERCVAEAVFRLEVALDRASERVSVGTQWNAIDRAAFQRRHDQRILPTRDALSLLWHIYFDAGWRRGRPVDEIDAVAGGIGKIPVAWNGEHRGDRRLQVVGPRTLVFARHRGVDLEIAKGQLMAGRRRVGPARLLLGLVIAEAGDMGPAIVLAGQQDVDFIIGLGESEAPM
jgi:hypothetical protein